MRFKHFALAMRCAWGGSVESGRESGPQAGDVGDAGSADSATVDAGGSPQDPTPPGARAVVRQAAIRDARVVHGERAAGLVRAVLLATVVTGAGCGTTPGAGVDDAGGGKCVSDVQCGGGSARVCALDVETAPVDLIAATLVCAAPSASGAPGTACELPADCDRGLCVVAGRCVTACEGDGDCGAGERCADVYLRASPGALQPARACVTRVELPDAVVVETSESPLVAAGRPVTLRLPTGAPGTASVIEPSAPAHLTASALATVAPVVTLFDVAHVGPADPAPVSPLDILSDTLTVRVPLGSTPVASPMGVDLTVVPSSETSLRATTVSRAREGRVLDLRFFYVGVSREPGGSEPAPWLAAALVEVARIFGAADLVLGEVTHHDVVGALATRYAVVDRVGDDLPELSELLRLSAGARGPAVSVFLVREVDGALGISGAIPGPPGMHGTPASGIAISTDMFAGDSLGLALTIAHEVGHYLGLFHTSESDGTILDSLDDTGECRPAQDANGDGVLSFEECITLGGASLMFWSARVSVLSFEQRRVLRESIVLR